MASFIDAFWDERLDLLALRLPHDLLLSNLDGTPAAWLVFAGKPQRESPSRLIAVIEHGRADPSGAHEGWSVVKLPKGERQVILRPLDVMEDTEDIEILLQTEDSLTWSEVRLGIANTNTAQLPIEVRSLNVGLDPLEAINRVKPNLRDATVLATACRRRRIRRNGPARGIGPAELVWPAPCRVEIEPVLFERSKRGESRNRNLTMIQEAARTEELPLARLKIRFNGRRSAASDFARTFVLVHVMQQRRRVRLLDERRRRASDAPFVIEALSLEELRELFGDSVAFDAVKDNSTIVGCNLGDAMDRRTAEADEPLANADSPAAQAFIMSTTPDGALLVEFAFASLGDDIGIASSSAEEGYLVVRNGDLGGDPRLRLFRVGTDRLEALELDQEVDLVDEVLDVVMDKEDLPDEIDHRRIDAGPWAAFVKRLGLPPQVATPRPGWETPLDAHLLSAWADIVRDHRLASEVAAADFASYRRSPQLVAVLARYRGLGLPGARPPVADGDFFQQIAQAFGAPKLVASRNPPSPRELWPLFADHPTIVADLIRAQIVLEEGTSAIELLEEVARRLRDELQVEMALDACEDRGRNEDAARFQSYLDDRRRGEWSPVTAVTSLMEVMRDVVDDAIETHDPPRVTARGDQRPMGVLLSTVQRLLREQTKEPGARDEVDRLRAQFDSRAATKRLDRRILLQFEKKLLEFSEPDFEKMFDEMTVAIEDWARVPGCVENFKARLFPPEQRVNRMRLVEAFVTRLSRGVKPAPKNGFVEGLDHQRRQMEGMIRRQIAERYKAGGIAELRRDVGRQTDDVVAYGDLLLFQRARVALEGLLSSGSDDQANRLRRRLAVDWPRDAVDIWKSASEYARQIGSSEFDLQLPGFDEVGRPAN
jgi:hypothetical protein